MNHDKILNSIIIALAVGSSVLGAYVYTYIKSLYKLKNSIIPASEIITKGTIGSRVIVEGITQSQGNPV